MENLIVDVILCTIPSLIMFLAVYFVMNRMLQNDERRRQIEVIIQNKQTTLPLRLQAYERLILFLERISPDSLLIRVKEQAQTNGDLHFALLKTIRAEFEHNQTQQLYVGSEAWHEVKSTKDDVTALINEAAQKVPRDGASIELSKAIMDSLINSGISPVANAIEELKKEAKKMF